ncbi:MAG TPA: tRNA pseudouridine(38-40) synthase TruA [Bacteroidota bacterium]|nr:tRNA pseudouridine(38-40) synthase TruA [Bacteroidota bacterium]
MARFRIDLEYEGTRYSGWQIQKNARTIQGELLAAARTVFKTTALEIYGAGRTDAGVHALRQVAHLDAQTVLAPEIIRRRINDELPADINLIEVAKAPSSFHARHSAVARSYLYQISRRRTAFGKKFVWWIRDPLDVAAMSAALALFTGMKNFRSFTADDEDEKPTSVLVEEILHRECGDLLLIRVVGSHFLWKQVRQMIGVAAEVGRGDMSLRDVRKFLSSSSDEPARFTAPPSGLFLERVYYPGERRLRTIEPVLAVESFGR